MILSFQNLIPPFGIREVIGFLTALRMQSQCTNFDLKEEMFKRLVSGFIFIVLVFLGMGCATRRSIPDAQVLEGDEGIIVVSVSSNVSGAFGYGVYSNSALSAMFSGPLPMWGSGGDSVRVRRGENVYVVRAKAGDYMWTGFVSGNSSFKFRARNRFTVKAGGVNYLGNIQLTTEYNIIHMRVDKDEDAIRSRLEKTHPEYYRSLPFYGNVTWIFY